MGAVGAGEPRDERSQIAFAKPFWQALSQHPLPGSADARHNNDGAFAARKSGRHKTRERTTRCRLRVSMKIERAADVDATAPNPFLAAAIGEFGGSAGARGRELAARRALPIFGHHRRFGSQLRRRLGIAWLRSRFDAVGDAPPQRALFWR